MLYLYFFLLEVTAGSRADNTAAGIAGGVAAVVVVISLAIIMVAMVGCKLYKDSSITTRILSTSDQVNEHKHYS